MITTFMAPPSKPSSKVNPHSPPTTNATTSFSFVTCIGNPAISVKTKEHVHAVKSHVMRRVHGANQGPRRRRREGKGRVRCFYETGSRGCMAGVEGESEMRRDSESVRDGDERICEFQDEENLGDVNLLNLADQRLFPYQYMAIPTTPRIITLLQHDITDTVRTSVHADPTGLYWSYYNDDPARIYVTISYAAIRYGQVTKRDSQDAAHYFSKAVRLINQNLSDPKKRASDNMIATVSIFANLENLIGDHEKSRIHMDAVERMVELRGGLEMLGMGQILRRMVLWSDLLFAIRSETQPRFPLYATGIESSATEFLPGGSSAAIPFQPSTALLAISGKCGKEVVPILQQAHDLAMLLNAMPLGTGVELPIEIDYPDRVYMIEHQIVTTVNSKDSAFCCNANAASAISHILLHASLLYVYTNLRQTPVGGTMRRVLSQRLQEQLGKYVEINDLLVQFPAEMLWTCVLGLTTASDSTFWLKKLSTFWMLQGVRDWNDVSRMLKNMPVFENVFAAFAREVWMQNCQAFQNETAFEEMHTC